MSQMVLRDLSFQHLGMITDTNFIVSLQKEIRSMVLNTAVIMDGNGGVSHGLMRSIPNMFTPLTEGPPRSDCSKIMIRKENDYGI